VIPQVDGNGDEEEEEEDYVGDGYEGEWVAVLMLGVITGLLL
jgi:hypothetical protein